MPSEAVRYSPGSRLVRGSFPGSAADFHGCAREARLHSAGQRNRRLAKAVAQRIHCPMACAGASPARRPAIHLPCRLQLAGAPPTGALPVPLPICAEQLAPSPAPRRRVAWRAPGCARAVGGEIRVAQFDCTVRANNSCSRRRRQTISVSRDSMDSRTSGSPHRVEGVLVADRLRIIFRRRPPVEPASGILSLRLGDQRPRPSPMRRPSHLLSARRARRWFHAHGEKLFRDLAHAGTPHRQRRQKAGLQPGQNA